MISNEMNVVSRVRRGIQQGNTTGNAILPFPAGTLANSALLNLVKGRDRFVLNRLLADFQNADNNQIRFLPYLTGDGNFIMSAVGFWKPNYEVLTHLCCAGIKGGVPRVVLDNVFPFPLFGLDTLAEHPSAPVFLVGNEWQVARYASQYPGAAVVSFASHLVAFGNSDLTTLNQRHVSIVVGSKSIPESAVYNISEQLQAVGAASIRASYLPPE